MTREAGSGQPATLTRSSSPLVGVEAGQPLGRRARGADLRGSVPPQVLAQLSKSERQPVGFVRKRLERIGGGGWVQSARELERRVLVEGSDDQRWWLVSSKRGEERRARSVERSVGPDEEQGWRVRTFAEIPQELGAVRVGPLKIVDQEDQPALLGERAQELP